MARAHLPVPGSLEHAYRVSFRPRELAPLACSTRGEYDAAIERWRHFHQGRTVELQFVTAEMLDLFGRSMIDAGISGATATRHVARVRRVLEWIQPERRKEFRVAIKKDSAIIGVDGTIRHFFSNWYVAERPLAESTIQQYMLAIVLFGRYLGREPRLEDLTDLLLSQFILAHEARRAPSGLKGVRGCLLSIWRSAYEWELVEKLPRRVRKVQVPDPTPDAWTPQQWMLLVAAMRRVRPGRFRGRSIDRSSRLLAAAAVMYDTAFRLSDAMRLRRQDVDWNTGLVTIRQQKTKQPIVRRLRHATLELIALAHEDESELVVDWPWKRRSLWTVWRALLADAGLPVARRNGPQKIRRTSATQMAREEGPDAASELLGHKSVRSSLARRSYIDAGQAFPPPRLPPELPGMAAIAGLLPAPAIAAGERRAP